VVARLLESDLLEERIARARVHELRFEMSPPLRLAGNLVRTREYVVLELLLADGTVGTAYVLTRGQAVRDAVESLTESLIGRPIRTAFSHGSEEPDPLRRRAQALADICGWDLLGKMRSLPVWALIADSAAPRPALVVAGYRRGDESDAHIADRFVGLQGLGIRMVKIATEGAPRLTTDLLTAVRSRASASELELIVDMGYAGRTPDEAVAAMRAWQTHHLLWVEDPFRPAAAADIAAARALVTVPIAAGDEAAPSELKGILAAGAVDVLRIDATTTAGISGALALALQADLRVSFHIYPEVHRHLATTLHNVGEVELFMPNDPFDFVDHFITAEGLTIDRRGQVAVPEAPGLGLVFSRRRASANIASSKEFAAAP